MINLFFSCLHSAARKVILGWSVPNNRECFGGESQCDYRNSHVCLPSLSLLTSKNLIREDLVYSMHKDAKTSNKIYAAPFSSCFINKEQNVSRLSVTYAESDFKPDWDSFQMRVIIYSSNNNAFFFYCFACKVVSMLCEDKVICHFLQKYNLLLWWVLGPFYFSYWFKVECSLQQSWAWGIGVQEQDLDFSTEIISFHTN